MLKHVLRSLPLALACSLTPPSAARAAQEEPKTSPDSSQSQEATSSPESPPPESPPPASPSDPDLEGMPSLGGDPDLEGMPGLGGDSDLEGMPSLAGESTSIPTSTSSSEAEGTSATFRGRLRTLLNQDLSHDRPREDVLESQSFFDVESDLRLGSRLKARISGRLFYDVRGPEQDFGGRSRAFHGAELRDAVVSLEWGRASLDIGQQVLRWGSTEFSSPNDIINPTDYRQGLSPDFETPVLPIPMVRAAYSGDTAGGELVYVPLFFPHRGYTFNSDWTLLTVAPDLLAFIEQQASGIPARTGVAEELLFSADAPSFMPRHGSVGGRAFMRGAGWDVRLNVFYGWDRVPVRTLVPSTDPSAPVDTGSPFRREFSVGVDGSAVVGDIVFRADARYSAKRTFYTEALQPVREGALSWAGGFEFREHYMLELNGMWVPGRSAEDAPLALVDRRWTNVAFLYRDSFLRDELRVNLGLRYGITQEDWVISAIVAYDVSTGHEVAVGAMVLDGPALSLGGIYDANDYAFVRYTYSF
ncbi:DUF1302 domain-containing protein [Hyalangium gracile]|uniref:DUF1302 domain-containing protein n=1 Tax=Hyalangium gracile TaxID=394092 RepID=UPI001CCEFE5C|nr:DUF1302 domain-containing protein [Hyalangium gracile]